MKLRGCPRSVCAFALLAASWAIAQPALAQQRVEAWGYGGDGELGNGTKGNSDVPVPVSNLLSGITAIGGGTWHSVAVQNGGIYDWVYNDQGALGNNTRTNSSVPVAASGLSNGATAVAAGHLHSLAVVNGGVYAWGYNAYGALGNNSTTPQANTVPLAVRGLSSGVTAIAAGDEHSLAVQNGGVYAWGNNADGELGDGTTINHLVPERIDAADLTNIIAVAADHDGYSSYALSSDGSIWDWGYNLNGELGLGNTTTNYLTPQHLLPPTGYAFTAISANQNGAVAILTPVVVPEPANALLLALGVLALGRRRRG